jgi:hypothetical protein
MVRRKASRSVETVQVGVVGGVQALAGQPGPWMSHPRETVHQLRNLVADGAATRTQPLIARFPTTVCESGKNWTQCEG